MPKNGGGGKAFASVELDGGLRAVQVSTVRLAVIPFSTFKGIVSRDEYFFDSLRN
jgi:hypothetical protein